MTVPKRVLTNPPEEAIVTAVVVLKFATIISRPAEISNKPTGERIRAIEFLVVMSNYRHAGEDTKFTEVVERIYPPTCTSGSNIMIYMTYGTERFIDRCRLLA
jgi:hypothetical protein